MALTTELPDGEDDMRLDISLVRRLTRNLRCISAAEAVSQYVI